MLVTGMHICNASSSTCHCKPMHDKPLVCFNSSCQDFDPSQQHISTACHATSLTVKADTVRLYVLNATRKPMPRVSIGVCTPASWPCFFEMLLPHHSWLPGMSSTNRTICDHCGHASASSIKRFFIHRGCAPGSMQQQVLLGDASPAAPDLAGQSRGLFPLLPHLVLCCPAGFLQPPALSLQLRHLHHVGWGFGRASSSSRPDEVRRGCFVCAAHFVNFRQ